MLNMLLKDKCKLLPNRASNEYEKMRRALDIPTYSMITIGFPADEAFFQPSKTDKSNIQSYNIVRLDRDLIVTVISQNL